MRDVCEVSRRVQELVVDVESVNMGPQIGSGCNWSWISP